MPILWTDDDLPPLETEPCGYRQGDLHILCSGEPRHCIDSSRVAEYLIAIGHRPAQLNRTATALRR